VDRSELRPTRSDTRLANHPVVGVESRDGTGPSGATDQASGGRLQRQPPPGDFLWSRWYRRLPRLRR
jgi:hypothetical protein